MIRALTVAGVFLIGVSFVFLSAPVDVDASHDPNSWHVPGTSLTIDWDTVPLFGYVSDTCTQVMAICVVWPSWPTVSLSVYSYETQYSYQYQTPASSNGGGTNSGGSGGGSGGSSGSSGSNGGSGGGSGAPACSDGIDNDGDTYADFPDDPGCFSAADTDEFDVSSAVLSLSAVPALVRAEASTRLDWSATNAQAGSCTLSGQNGDFWNLSGLSGSETSSAIAAETLYTLRCLNLTDEPTTQTVKVKVLPQFQEI